MVGLALCVTAASCSSDDDAASAPNTLSATATVDNSDTRTSYIDQGEQGLEVDWEDRETFKAYYTKDDTTPLIFNKTEGSAFVATDVPAGVSASTKFIGVYGEKVTYDAATGKYTIDYSGQDGTLANLAKYDAMVATSTTDEDGLMFPFEHLSAFVRVTIKQDASDSHHKDEHSTAEGLKKLYIKFKNCTLIDEHMAVQGFTSGTYTISLTLNDSQLASASESHVLYFAIPALKLENPSDLGFGSSFEFYDEGYYKTVSATIDFEAGMVYETIVTYYCGEEHGDMIIG